MSATSGGKTKLRTAGDVISRLKWSLEEDSTQIVMGYDDRINGPMEKTLADYTPIDLGGDIPQHRIRYFRRASAGEGDANTCRYMNRLILWDRDSRVDRLFGSGLGANAVVAPQTIHLVWSAIANMKRIAEEKEIRRQEKAKQRARKQQQQRAAREAKLLLETTNNSAAGAGASASAGASATPENSHTRFQWINVDWYEYSSANNNNNDNSDTIGEWRKGGIQATTTSTTSTRTATERQQPKQQLRMITWNVLFDKYESPLYKGDTATNRWTLMIQMLGKEEADVIALQEVTPQFVQLLCQTQWVQDGYAMSASSPNALSTVEPYGNLFLWKKSTLQPVRATTGTKKNNKQSGSLSVLVDGHTRKRSVVVCLQPIISQPNTSNSNSDNCVLVCANVHLPCDATSYNDNHQEGGGVTLLGVGGDQQQQQQQRQSRAVARRRELNTVVAKLQTLESHLLQHAAVVVPILLGDFNSDAKNGELEDGGFGSGGSNGMFMDVWPLVVTDGEEGITYHPTENQRARFSTNGPRRIDRICIGGRGTTEVLLQPLKGEVIGTPHDIPSREEFSPSDHYGVSVLFDLILPSQKSTQEQQQQQQSKLLTQQSAWARTVMPTTDTLLAVALASDVSSVGNITTSLFDPNSSLPVPHITLLNGFAELMCQESIDLATEAVTTAVAQTLASTDASCSVPFGRDSLTVFEHRSSATLVCKPEGPCQWLETLYQTLRSSFQFCDEQESRFVDGWSPHVSLGKFGSETDARQHANKLLLSPGQGWFQERHYLPALAVVIYQRNPNDRKFYTLASVPLEKQLPKKTIQSCNSRVFLADAGASLSSYFRKQSAPFVSNLERMCQTAINAMMAGEEYVEATLTKYGSCQFHASLPTISDIDAVVELSPKNGNGNDNNNIVIAHLFRNFSPSAYLQNVATTLKSIHPNSKIRVRIAGSNSNGAAVHFLTIKLNPTAPSIDLMVCLRSINGGAVVNTAMGSAAAAGSIEDGQLILQELQGLPPNGPADLMVQAFEGAVRLCKIWAYRRQIYGAPLGFLGGGGLALLIARAMSKRLRNGDLTLSMDDNGNNDWKKEGDNARVAAAAAMKVLSYSFKEMAHCWDQRIFTLEGTTASDEMKEMTLARGTVAVVAPASGGDFARNTTRSTSAVLLKEIQQANTILERSDDVGDLFLPIRQEELLLEESSVLFLEVDAGRLSKQKGAPCLPDVKAWAARQFLQTLVALESDIGNVDLIRPFSRPVRIKDELLYIIRIANGAGVGVLDTIARKRGALIQEEAGSFLGQTQTNEKYAALVRLRCLRATEFCQAFQTERRGYGTK